MMKKRKDLVCVAARIRCRRILLWRSIRWKRILEGSSCVASTDAEGRFLLCCSIRWRSDLGRISVVLQHHQMKRRINSASSFFLTEVVILLHGKTACHQAAAPHPKDGHLVGVEAWTRSSLFHAEMINPCSHMISSSPGWSPPYRLLLFELLICISDPWVQFHTILGARVLMMFAAPDCTKLSLSSSLRLEFPTSLVPPPAGIVALREWW